MDNIDVTSYVTRARFSAMRGLFIARALLDAAPPNPSDRIHRALVYIRETGEQLRLAVDERATSSPSNMRKLDATLDAGWLCLRGVLEALARLVGTDAGNRAAAIHSQVFPNDGEFLRFTYPDQWAGSDLALTRIAERDLEEAINELVGPEVLPYIRSAHEAFGTALGLNANAPEPQDTTALRKALGELSFAIAEYGRLMVGELDRDDPESRQRFLTAMAPIDAQRARSRRARDVSEPEPTEPEEPVVDLDEPMPELDPPAPEA